MKLNWRKLLFTSYEVMSVVFLVVVATIGVVALYSKFSHTSQIKLLSVVSGSMTPAIGVGSAVVVLSQADYYINDIVTYRLGSNLVTHRVIFAHNYYLTKGDANKEIDPKTVSKNDIVGKVVLTLPYVGFLQESTKNPLGLLFFILVPSILIIIHESWIIIREMKKLDFKLNFNFSKNKPIIGVVVGVLLWLSISPDSVLAYFHLTKPLFNLQISTATFTPSPSASASASPTSSATASPSPSSTSDPTTTPSPTASSTFHPSPSGIGNTGNGSGSTNVIIINNNSSTTVNQSNTSTQTTTVNNTVNTGNNSGGDVNTATGSATTTITNSSNSNSVIIH